MELGASIETLGMQAVLWSDRNPDNRALQNRNNFKKQTKKQTLVYEHQSRTKILMKCKPFLSSYVSTKAVYVVLTTQKSITYFLILSSLVLSYY